MTIRLVVSGRNYDAAASLPPQLSLPDGAALDDAIVALAAILPAGVRLPDSCLVAVSGKHVGTLGRHRPECLRDGDELMLIAPVAGG